jgi:hypothetical protein
VRGLRRRSRRATPGFGMFVVSNETPSGSYPPLPARASWGAETRLGEARALLSQR